ncbi:MAG: aminotransferase class IV [Mobilicoccus sp.]|nr:aminotransferase class IV [Mobilicoccus sp.]
MSTLQQIAAVHGRGLVPADSPVVGMDDLGLTRGHGCFDATRVTWGEDGPVVDMLEAHVARLERSAAALGIEGPLAPAWHELVDGVCGAWQGTAEAMLKLVLTGGGETTGGAPVAYVTLTEIAETSLREREGISVATLSRGMASDAFADAPWLLGGVKTIAYAVNLAAKAEARRRGADDALFVSTDGVVLEGPTSAVVLREGNRLVTTPTGDTGVLASVTIERMTRAVEDEDVTLTTALFSLDRLLAADGAWFVSSVRGVAPMRRIDDTDMPVDTGGDALVRRLAGF